MNTKNNSAEAHNRAQKSYYLRNKATINAKQRLKLQPLFPSEECLEAFRKLVIKENTSYIKILLDWANEKTEGKNPILSDALKGIDHTLSDYRR